MSEHQNFRGSVLIAEDDPITAIMIKTALTKAGLSAVIASNGSRAISILEDNQDIQVVVTDAIMPECNGRQLIRYLRSKEQWIDLPIILVSGLITLNEINTLLDAGASYFQTKPIDLPALVNLVQRSIAFGLLKNQQAVELIPNQEGYDRP